MEPDITTTAAIALCGRHPMMLIGGKTPRPAAETARAMAEALPEMTVRETRESDGILKRAGANDQAGRRPRAVETTPGDQVLGDFRHPGCAELAHGGVLAADDLQRWKEEQIAETLVAAFRGIARNSEKLVVPCDCRVVASTTGCKCPRRGEACHCDDNNRELANRKLWYASTYALFDIACAGPDFPGQIDTAKLRKLNRKARLFATTTRDQPQANARTLTKSQLTGWTMTAGARRKLTRTLTLTRFHRIDYERSVQIARSCADLSGTARIQEQHIDTALSLTITQRRYGFR